MTKWFDTNYHYMVPEFQPGQRFSLASTKPVDEYREALALGFRTRPVLLGPVSFLKLGKCHDASFDRMSLLAGLVPVYIEVLRRLSANGADWVQLDEPCLVLDLSEAEQRALRDAYGMIAYALPKLKIMLTSYFGGLGGNLATALALPVAGLHLDLVRAPDQLYEVLPKAPRGLVLSLGVIDGRNIWRADLDAILMRLESVVGRRGADHLELAPSCSLLHVPVDLDLETDLDSDLRRWLAFSCQKMDELSVLGPGAGAGPRRGARRARRGRGSDRLAQVLAQGARCRGGGAHRGNRAVDVVAAPTRIRSGASCSRRR